MPLLGVVVAPRAAAVLAILVVVVEGRAALDGTLVHFLYMAATTTPLNILLHLLMPLVANLGPNSTSV
jgi:hypothetical protein